MTYQNTSDNPSTLTRTVSFTVDDGRAAHSGRPARLDAPTDLPAPAVGHIDPDGFLVITDRKKDIIVTSGGKNIAPKNIETALKALPLVSEAVVIGERRKFLSAVLTLNPDTAAQFAAENGIEGQVLHENPLVIAEIQRGVDEQVNPQFARVENVRKFAILPRNLTVEHGELTPTLKIKRRVVYDHFEDEIESMYAGLN